ncbi:MAG: O-antigen ligase family protein [Anaerolineae bacterium]|nr:O-antigen ligase family protein [Anaerolineae bacterium]
MPRKVHISSRWRARLLILFVVYFTFLGGTFTTDFNYWPRVSHHIIVTVLMAGWLISLLRRGESLPCTPLDWPMLAIFACYATATVLAVDPRVSVESLWQIGFHVLLFYLLVDIMRAWKPRAILEPIFFSSAVVILIGLIEFVSWYFGLSWLSIFQQGWFQIGGLRDPIPPVIYRLSFTLGVPTILSAYLALLTPIGLAWCVSASKPDIRRGLGIWLVGALIVQFLSFSRGGLLSLAVSLPTFGALVVIGRPNWRERIGFALRDWRLWSGLVGVLIVLGVAGLLWMRQAGLAGHTSGDSIRMDLWQSAWHVGLEHPLTGVGPYGFGRAMRLFRDPVITSDRMNSAHNIPLHVWAEAGLFGIAALVSLVCVTVGAGWRCWQSTAGSERIKLAGVIAALVGFSVHNQVEMLVGTLVMLPCLALVAFLVASIRDKPMGPSTRWRRAVPAFLLGVIALSAVGWAISDVAQYHLTQAVRLSGKNDLVGAVQSIQQARRLDPAMGYYLAEEAYYLGRLADQDDAYLEDALAAYEDFLSRENTYGLNRANYAMLLAQSGQVHDALSEMRAARVFDPAEARYMLWVGELAELDGDRDSALSAYREALEMKPHWAGSFYWEKTSLRSEARMLFLEERGLQDWEPEMLGIVSSQCWPVSQAVSEPSSSLVCRGELSLRVSGDAPAALAWLNQAIEAGSTVPWPYLLRAEAYLAIGDLDMAERDARMALFLEDTRAYYVLGRIAEARGNIDDAISAYQKSIPLVYRMQGWDAVVYARRGDVDLLPQLDAPGPSRYDLASALALIDLYETQGRDADAQTVRDFVHWLDPYFEPDLQ